MFVPSLSPQPAQITNPLCTSFSAIPKNIFDPLKTAQMPAFDDQKLPAKLLIAVDFGTTFSGAAYVYTRNHYERPIIQDWGDGVPTGEKVPTVLKYDEFDKTSYRWGFQVKEEEQGKCEWFKLDLYDKIEETSLTRKYHIKTPQQESLNQPSREQMVVDYLRSLVKHVENYLEDKLLFIWETTPREWIITVPAVWPDKSKAKTREYAKMAGMGDNIQIVAEPEAAGIYALQNMRMLGLEVDDTFVVCDAGGGTVDLISYTVASLDPPAVKEAASGAGGLCGGTYLNRGFAAYLDKKFANVPAWNANASYRSNAMRVFEKDIKMTFTYDEAQVWRIPVMGLDDNLVLGIRNGHLTVPWKDVQKVFEPVVREIVKLVKAQITATTNLGDHRVKMILLAGGFGRNKYLRSRLQDEVGGVIKVRNIENGNTSIVRGALIRGLAKLASDVNDETFPYMRINSRMARCHYGTMGFETFDPNKEGHDHSRKEWDEDAKEWRIHVMHWFINQGDAVKESKLDPPLQYFVRKAVDLGPLQPMEINIYTYEDRPGFKRPSYDTSDVKLLVKLKADLGKIPTDSLRTQPGKNQRMFYVANYDIDIVVHSASLSFTLVHAGTTYQAVEAKFV